MRGISKKFVKFGAHSHVVLVPKLMLEIAGIDPTKDKVTLTLAADGKSINLSKTKRPSK